MRWLSSATVARQPITAPKWPWSVVAGHWRIARAYGQRTDLHLEWIAPDTLRIAYSTANPVRQEHLVDGIVIVYGKAR